MPDCPFALDSNHSVLVKTKSSLFFAKDSAIADWFSKQTKAMLILCLDQSGRKPGFVKIARAFGKGKPGSGAFFKREIKKILVIGFKFNESAFADGLLVS